jgi:hypothetical protein
MLSRRWLGRAEKKLESAAIEYRPQAYCETEAALLGKLREGAGHAVLDLDGIATLDTNALRRSCFGLAGPTSAARFRLPGSTASLPSCH